MKSLYVLNWLYFDITYLRNYKKIHTILIYTILHLFSFKTPIMDTRKRKNAKSIVGISHTMVLLFTRSSERRNLET